MSGSGSRAHDTLRLPSGRSGPRREVLQVMSDSGHSQQLKALLRLV